MRAIDKGFSMAESQPTVGNLVNRTSAEKGDPRPEARSVNCATSLEFYSAV